MALRAAPRGAFAPMAPGDREAVALARLLRAVDGDRVDR
jgi:hypothetical protein